LNIDLGEQPSNPTVGLTVERLIYVFEPLEGVNVDRGGQLSNPIVGLTVERLI
tara:strand:+ start:90 stop:248 length:159 start_codon:yes stop_codon:yes gene_type:complete